MNVLQTTALLSRPARRPAALFIALLVALTLTPLPALAQSPPPPAAVTLSRADGTLTATWNAPANAAAYHVTYTANDGQSWSLGRHGPHADHLDARAPPTTTPPTSSACAPATAADDWNGWTNSALIRPLQRDAATRRRCLRHRQPR